MSEAHRRLRAYSWPAAQLDRGLWALSEQSGLSHSLTASPIAFTSLSPDELSRRLDEVAAGLGLEVEPASTTYAQLEPLLRRGGPAILRLSDLTADRYLLLLSGRARQVKLLTPALEIMTVPLESVRASLAGDLEARLLPEVTQMLETVGIPAKRRQRAHRAMLAQRIGARPIEAGWLLRLPPGANSWAQFRQARLLRLVLAVIGSYAVQHALFLLAWWLIGRAILQGTLAAGWLWAWLLVLFTIIPFRLLFTQTQATLALRVATLLKRRLFEGVLRLEPDEVRHQGIGQFLGSVLESESVEQLALSGGFSGLVAVLELLFAAAVLALGAGSGLSLLLLLLWLLAGAFLARRYYRQRDAWTGARLAMTHDLVEQMSGHRTRLIQEAPEQRHRQEELALDRYLSLSQSMDGTAAQLSVLLPRGWLLLGLVGLAPAFVAGVGPERLAIGLGGTLLAYRALEKLGQSVTELAGAAIIWRQVTHLYRAAGRPEPLPDRPQPLPDSNGKGRNDTPLLEARSLAFRYPGSSMTALRDGTFRLEQDARVLLQGPSGAGKSTLAALLAGLRHSDSGTLCLHGLDQQAIGMESWRRHIVAVPQFQENHILTAPLAFNLLLGRRWPAGPELMQEAEALCRQLGLADLLAAMPSGLQQMVGESGWQLSHGERSRLYLARALLQEPELIVIDESFAALDPENLRHALQTAQQRRPALIVIAHP